MNRSKIIIPVLVLSWIMFYACTENINHIYIVDDGCIHDKDTIHGEVTDTSGSRILFNATIESLNTKSMTMMGTNEIASIYSYQGNPSDLSVPYRKVEYKTKTAGALVPFMKNDTLQVPHGSYSFYSISTNSDQAPPDFINGYSAPLKNGIDYLWWRTVNYQVRAPLVIVPVFYTHSATQVVVKLIAGKGITLDELVSAEIYPSAAGASMSEVTGIIPQTSSYNNQLVRMGHKDFYTQYTMLPLKTNKPMGAYFTVKINGEPQAKVYKVNISLPVNGLEGGKSYLFEAIIDATNIEFTQVNVIDWVTVDQTGSPLYPSQI